MRVRVECGRGFSVDLDEERPIQRRALMAVAEQVANRLEELERFAARVASLQTVGEILGSQHVGQRPQGLDQTTLDRLILRARVICGIETGGMKQTDGGGQ
jgi:hypothetical protein